MRGFLRSLAGEGRAVLVSSHLMAELQDTADHLVVVGRGKVIADTSVAELIAAASGGRVSLRTAARAGRDGGAGRRGRAPWPPPAATRSPCPGWRPSASWPSWPPAGCRSRRSPRTAPRSRRPTWSSPATRSSSAPPPAGRGSRMRANTEEAAMSTGTITPYRSGQRPGRDDFPHLLRAEWTKFRTVRGWVIAMVAAALLTALAVVGPRGCLQRRARTPELTRPLPSARAARRSPTTSTSSTSHWPATAASPSGSPRCRHRAPAARPARAPHAGRALGQGRDHHQGEHQARLGLRRGHGHPRPRGADAVRLHPRPRRPARCRLRGVAALAAADPLRRHDHRIRLRRRHALGQDRHGRPRRAAAHRAGRALRNLTAPACGEWHRPDRRPARPPAARRSPATPPSSPMPPGPLPPSTTSASRASGPAARGAAAR